MKLFKQEQIETLARFNSENFYTTSLYFDTDKSRLTKKEIALSLKNLIAQSRAQLNEFDLSRKKKDSLSRDLDKINRFFSQNLNSYSFSGLAIFSCSGEEFWKIFELHDPPRNRIIFDKNPYVRPLSAILNEHKKICLLTIDRRAAKWYEISMGEIRLLKSAEGDVPSKVREGGWEGYESKRIERHINTHLRDHFKNVSAMTFEMFKKNNFDWLFLGCMDEYYPELEPLLHPYLKNNLKGRLKTTPSHSPDKILKESLRLEKNIKKQEDDELVCRFISELEKGGLAVSGLRETLRRLNQGEVQILLITRNFSEPGRICSHCKFLFVDEKRCPSCQRKTEAIVDIIDEAVERAMEKRCRVKHIDPPSKLRKYGDIGGLMRYKT